MSIVDAAEVIIDLLQRGHAVEFRVRGDSMHPLIREDDSVHVEPSHEVRIGDVVLTLATRGLTAHRVVAIRGETIITRGDNTPEADPPLSRAQVLGTVTWIQRNGKLRRAGLHQRLHLLWRSALALRRFLAKQRR